MKHVLMISYEFPPVGGSGVQRVSKFVRYLPKYGWQPVVLTVDGSAEDFSDPTLLDGIAADTPILRTPSDKPGYASWLSKRSWGRAILRASSFPDVHGKWRRKALAAGLELIARYEIQAIFSTDPPTAHWVACMLSEKTGLPWVMDIRDLWTFNFTYRPITYIHGQLDSALERKLICTARAVSCATQGFTSVLAQHYPSVKSDKFKAISNGYDEADFKGITRQASSKFTLLYSGLLYDFAVRPRPAGWKKLFEPLTYGDGQPEMVRSPRWLFEGLKDFLEVNPQAGDQLKMVFVGNFPEKFKSLVVENGLEQVVKYTGYLKHQEAIQQLVSANVLFLMQAGKGSEVVVPGKLYEYLRSGNAILGLFPEGESTEIIRKACAGAVLNPKDREGIKNQIAKWFALWQAGKPLISPNLDYIRRFEREQSTIQLADVLNQVTTK